MSAAVLPFERPGEPPAGYEASVKSMAAAVRRELAQGVGYAAILEAARKANTGGLPDRMVIQIVDYGVTSGWRS